MNALRTTPGSLILAALLSLASASSARAEEARGAATSVAQLNEQGAELYAARDDRRAIEKFIQAYAIDEDPNLLFNIARCYEELGEADAAIEKYEAFLATPGSDARGRQRARDSLAALRQARAQGGTAGTPAAGSDAPEPSSAATQSAQPLDAGPGESSVLPWVALGGGVAFATAGTVFYLLGRGDHAKLEDADGYGDPDAVSSLTRAEAEDLKGSGDTKKLIGGIGLGVGGALLATYVVMLVAGDSSESAAPPATAAVGLSPDASGAVFTLQGSF